MSHPARPRPRRDSAGFSLVETLVATALFSFILLGTLPMFLRAVQDSARNRNQLHFNQGISALNDELIQRCGSKFAFKIATADCINSGDAALTLGWHVFNNYTSYPPGTATPRTVTNLLLGTGSTLNTDRAVQNNLLGQVQYFVSQEFGRVRVDLQIYYFKGSGYVRTVNGLCTSVNTSCDPAVAPPPHMAVARMSSYIDLPM